MADQALVTTLSTYCREHFLNPEFVAHGIHLLGMNFENGSLTFHNCHNLGNDRCMGGIVYLRFWGDGAELC